jgi:hypothetical protein
MRLALNINYEVSDEDQETEEALADVVGQEAHDLANRVRPQLQEAGVRIEQMTVESNE